MSAAHLPANAASRPACSRAACTATGNAALLRSGAQAAHPTHITPAASRGSGMKASKESDLIRAAQQLKELEMEREAMRTRWGLGSKTDILVEGPSARTYALLAAAAPVAAASTSPELHRRAQQNVAAAKRAELIRAPVVEPRTLTASRASAIHEAVAGYQSSLRSSGAAYSWTLTEKIGDALLNEVLTLCAESVGAAADAEVERVVKTELRA